MIRKISSWLAVLVVLGGGVLAQSSASYNLEEHVFNSGGHPLGGTSLASASFKISLDSVGEGISARGLSSASYGLDTSFGAAYPPPGEVSNLLFSNRTTLVWDPEASIGVYNLYRDTISNITGLGFGSCEQQELTDETTTDNDAVPAGDGYFYLVTAENRLDEEGTKGFRSNGTERGNTTPCP